MHARACVHICACVRVPLTLCCLLLRPTPPRPALPRSWDILIMMLVVYTAITVPLDVSFGMPRDGAVSGLRYGLDVLFALDLGVQFRTAYFNHQVGQGGGRTGHARTMPDDVACVCGVVCLCAFVRIGVFMHPCADEYICMCVRA